MLVAGITLLQIFQLIFLFTVVNAVLLAPLMVAIAGVYREYVENKENRRLRQRGGTRQ